MAIPTAKAKGNFSDRRKEYRLPFHGKLIFTDGSRTMTSYSANISRGGLFVLSLDPFPIDTEGFAAFMLPGQPLSLCIKARVAHIVFDRQRAEIECGMGFQFLEMNDSLRGILASHVDKEKDTYLEINRLIAQKRPDSGLVNECLERMPHLKRLDLMALRYRVQRICTLFESVPELGDEGMEEIV